MLGTNPYPFIRLTDQVIKWADKTGEHVIIQSGNTPISNSQIETHPFIDHSKLMDLMSQARIVITQGGFGSLQDCIQNGAKTVAVPRLVELGESNDDQTEIVRALAEQNLVIPLYDEKQLETAIEAAMQLNRKTSNKSELPKHVAETINTFIK